MGETLTKRLTHTLNGTWTPTKQNNNIYIDGALFSSNPINNAIKNIIDLNLNTVLAFKLINKENSLVIKNIFNYNDNRKKS